MSPLIGYTMTSGKPWTYTSTTRKTEHVVVMYLSMHMYTYITTTKEKRHAWERARQGIVCMGGLGWNKVNGQNDAIIS